MLAEAPAGRHFGQFHRDEEALGEAVHLFLEGGLRRGNSIVLIAAPARSERYLARLQAARFHPKALRGSGQLDLIDVAPLLDQFMLDGTPNSARFNRAFGAIFERVQRFGRGIRIYTEIADTLWQRQNADAAIRVEELWNALARVHSFALYCGYAMDTQCERSFTGPLEDVGRAHSDILGTDDDERFGAALDRASKEIFGISLSQMAGVTRQDGARRFPSGQRNMLWVKRNLPLSAGRLTELARQYFQQGSQNHR